MGVINGRAAMVAFLAAAGAELATHDSVFKQLGEGGLWGMFVVFAAVTAASFAPLARGKSVQETFLKNGKPEEFGPSTRTRDAQRPRRHDGLPHASHPRGALR